MWACPAAASLESTTGRTEGEAEEDKGRKNERLEESECFTSKRDRKALKLARHHLQIFI